MLSFTTSVNKFVPKACLPFLLLVIGFSTYAQNAPADLPAATAGLQINRPKLAKMINYYAVGLNLKRDKDVKGQPNFTGSDEVGEQAQLIGTDDNLVLARWTFTMKRSKETNVICINHLASFVQYLAEQRGGEWFKQQMQIINANPLVIYANTETFAYNRKAEFSYSPRDRSITVTFTPTGN